VQFVGHKPVKPTCFAVSAETVGRCCLRCLFVDGSGLRPEALKLPDVAAL